LAKSSLISFVDDVDNPWISSISTRIYPSSMDIYPDASGCIHGSPYSGESAFYHAGQYILNEIHDAAKQ
jgi:hypothetical protein